MSENPYSNAIKYFEDLIPLSEWVEPALTILKENMVTDSGHDESHLLRVTKNALWFADEEGEYDKDILIPACLLHDLVNLPKDHPNRKLASEMSAAEGCSKLFSLRSVKSAEQGIGVYHAIQAHSYSANVTPTTIEAKALQDADRLDALGYIGLARLFAVSGSMGRQLFHPTDPLLISGRPLEEDKYAVDHFFTKLVKLPDTMQTKRGTIAATIKVDQMKVFLGRLTAEARCELFI